MQLRWTGFKLATASTRGPSTDSVKRPRGGRGLGGRGGGGRRRGGNGFEAVVSFLVKIAPIAARDQVKVATLEAD